MRTLSKAELSCVTGAGAGVSGSHPAAGSDYAKDISDALTSEKAQSVYRVFLSENLCVPAGTLLAVATGLGVVHFPFVPGILHSAAILASFGCLGQRIMMEYGY